MHWGLQGLESSNRLIAQACAASDEPIVLRNRLYRLAMDEKQARQLQQTAAELPQLATYLTLDEIKDIVPTVEESKVVGGLCLQGGCRVIHVPSYLRGLWAASRRSGRATWSLMQEATLPDLTGYDAVVLAAGAGLFSDVLSRDDWPIQLVRGQSIELAFDDEMLCTEALLSGKYISPLIDRHRVLVGATHEFADPLSYDQVVSELYQRTVDMSPSVWGTGSVDRLTSGVRVQSERGKYGRRPIVGRVLLKDFHSTTWVFTGLSSRGLLYHGIYGSLLAEAVLEGSEEPLLSVDEEILWWRH